MGVCNRSKKSPDIKRTLNVHGAKKHDLAENLIHLYTTYIFLFLQTDIIVQSQL